MLKHLELSTDCMQYHYVLVHAIISVLDLIIFSFRYLQIFLIGIWWLSTMWSEWRALHGLPVPGFHDYIAAWRLNKWKSFSNSTTEPQSGRAERMEMWAEWAAKTTSLWLWLQGHKEETRTPLSKKGSNMEASAQREQIGRSCIPLLPNNQNIAKEHSLNKPFLHRGSTENCLAV